MAFTKLTSFSKKPSDLPDVPSPSMTPDDIRSMWETPLDELLGNVQNTVDKLNSTTSGSSGADNIGATGWTGVANTIQALINWLKANKTDLTGDHKGTWHGFNPSQTDPGIQGQVDSNTSQLADIVTLKPNGTDDTLNLQNAINSSNKVELADGTFKITSKITINKHVEIYGRSRFGTILMKDGNFDAIEVIGDSGGNGMSPVLSSFTLDSTKNGDTSRGIKITVGGRAQLKNLLVQNQGSHGIEHNDGNLAYFGNLMLVSNGGDGLLFNGATPPNSNNNACVIENIDARSNNGWGVNINAGICNFGVGITTQGNGGGGVRINDKNNQLKIYSEANTNYDVLLTNSQYTIGNFIESSFGVVTDQSSGDNVILTSSVPGRYVAKFLNFISNNLKLQPVDGSGMLGFFQALMTADRTLEIQSYNSTGRGLVKVSNAVSGQVTDLTATGDYLGRVASPRQIFPNGNPTPSVAGGNYFLCNDSAVNTITNFLNGANGQVIYVGLNNTNTTIQSNTNIKLKGNTNFTGNKNDILQLIYDNATWKEVSRSNNTL